MNSDSSRISSSTIDHDLFSVEEGERGETDIVQFETDTGDSPSQKQPLRRMPFVVRQEVAKQLKQMQKSVLLSVAKSGGDGEEAGWYEQIYVDYRGLNAVTKTDTLPLPHIDELLDQLGKARYFSTLDLASGFWSSLDHERKPPLLLSMGCLN